MKPNLRNAKLSDKKEVDSKQSRVKTEAYVRDLFEKSKRLSTYKVFFVDDYIGDLYGEGLFEDRVLNEHYIMDKTLNASNYSRKPAKFFKRGYPDFSGLNLRRGNLRGANLTHVNLSGADLINADLRGANLTGTDLSDAILSGADFSNADLRDANLNGAQIVEAKFIKANLTGCSIFGISAWGLELEGAEQNNLIITPFYEPLITVDNIEIAQFIYLLLNNNKIRHVIDAITSKVVLILGRFTPERKLILDAIRQELRRLDYLPILFDFDKPSNRDITETVSTLAHIAKFVIADITDAKSIPQELLRIVPSLPSVPVQPLLLDSQFEYGMFEHFKHFPWVLETYLYNEKDLLINLKEKVIEPAEAKAKLLIGK